SALSTSTEFRHTFRWKTRGDAIRWIKIVGKNLGTAEHPLLGGYLADVQDLMLAQEQATKDHELLLASEFSQNAAYYLRNPFTGETHFSQSLVDLFGVEWAEISAENMDDLALSRFHPEEIHLHEQRRALLAEGKVPDEEEFRLCMPDGKIKWVTHQVRQVANSPCHVGAFRDITHSKLSAIKAEEIEEKFTAFLDHLPMPAWIKDSEYRYVLANRALETFYERSNEEIIGKTDFEINPPEVAEEFRKFDKLVIEEGKTLEARETAKFRDGTAFHSQSYKFPIRDSHGTRYSGGVGININALVESEQELHRKEEALKHSEARYKGIFDTTFSFIGFLDKDGTVLDANQTALSFAGLDLQDVKGKPFWECRWWTISEKTQDQLRAAVEEAGRGKFVRYSVEVLGLPGHTEFIDFSINPILDEHGEVMFLIPEGRVVTEILALQNQLLQQQRLLQAGEKVGQIGTWILHSDNQTLDYSEGLLDIYELDPALASPQKVIGQIFERIHPDDRQKNLDANKRLLSEGEFEELEFRIVMPDGRLKWVNLQMELSRPDHYLGITKDITAYKKASQELERLNGSLEREVAEQTAELTYFSECLQKLQILSSKRFDSTHMLVQAFLSLGVEMFGMPTGIISKIDGNDYEVKGLCTNLEGLSIGQHFELANTLCSEVVQSEATVCHFAIGNSPLQTHPVYQALSLESYVGSPIRVNNQIYGTLNFSSQEVVSQTNLSAIQKIVELMSQTLGASLELFQAQNALRRSEAKFRTLAEQSPVGITLSKTNQELIYLNNAFVAMLGYTLEDTPNLDWKDFTYPEDLTHNLALIGQLMAGEKDHIQFQKRYYHKDGHVIWASLHVTTILSEDQEERRILAMIQDITTQKEQEQAILKVNHELEQLIYTVSHDLRAPLRHIDAYSGMIAEDGIESLNESQRTSLSHVISSSRRLGVMIDELLDYAKSRSHELNLIWIDTNIKVASIVALFSADTMKNGIEWNIGKLPPIYGDARMVDKIFLNLISNAVKFSSKKEKPVISISGKKLPGHVEFTIQDNGAGFDTRFKSKLFEVFQRLHKQREFEGTGIGLANVQRLLDLHKGSIEADSVLGESATFSFTIPNPKKP
ncbi:MAG: PAS domain S-box protein, partial [Bacteroidia bacterium]|nr:PAS domain S-box protein [Bacteroidia bacterium]